MSMDKNVMLARLATQKITGKKYCMSCNNYVPIEGGDLVITKNKGRIRKSWRCSKCLEARKVNRLNPPSVDV